MKPFCLRITLGYAKSIIRSNSTTFQQKRFLRSKSNNSKLNINSESKPSNNNKIANRIANSYVDDVIGHINKLQIDSFEKKTEISTEFVDNNQEQVQNNESETQNKNEDWNWIPPTKIIVSENTSLLNTKDDDVIPVLKRTLLTNEEIIECLTRLGGINIQVINLGGRLDTIDDFIICTGTSTRHIRKMSDAIVKALVSREITEAPGFTGAEGGTDDDWIIVDCYNVATHLMLANTRKAMNLEGHWSSPNFNLTSDIMFNVKKLEPDDDQMTQLIDKNPIPSYYNNSDYDHSSLIDKDIFKNVDSNKSNKDSSSPRKNKKVKPPNKRIGIINPIKKQSK